MYIKDKYQPAVRRDRAYSPHCDFTDETNMLFYYSGDYQFNVVIFSDSSIVS